MGGGVCVDVLLERVTLRLLTSGVIDGVDGDDEGGSGGVDSDDDGGDSADSSDDKDDNFLVTSFLFFP